MLDLVLDRYKLPALVADCRRHRVRYGLGAKARPLAIQAAQLVAIDCSGFVRWAIYHASVAWINAHGDHAAYPLIIPDGSVVQHDWIDSAGFRRCELVDGRLLDDQLRIAFLRPRDGGGIGHVMLLQNGYTLESFGGTGPGRRKWLSQRFMARCILHEFGRVV